MSPTLARVAALGPPNAMRLMFRPDAFCPHIVNWEPTAASLSQYRDAARGVGGTPTRRLLAALLSYPTLGTPHDITAQELRIEAFFPADEATEAASRRLAHV